MATHDRLRRYQLLTIRPLGAIRVLRRYAAGAVLIVPGYLLIQLLRHPLPGLTHGTWSGYWAATDTVVAVAISFAPLAADYMRHSRSSRAAFAGAMAGYSVTQVLCYVIGLLALVTIAHGNRLGDHRDLGPAPRSPLPAFAARSPRNCRERGHLGHAPRYTTTPPDPHIGLTDLFSHKPEDCRNTLRTVNLAL